MKTLYLRKVPEEVARRLEKLAERDGMSVSAFVVRELGFIAARADNPSLVGELPDLDVAAESVVAEIVRGRADR